MLRSLCRLLPPARRAAPHSPRAFPAPNVAATVPLAAILTGNGETPTPTVNASGYAVILVHVEKNSDGSIAAAAIDFNVSYKFPGATNIVGLHIHKGAAGTNGPIVYPTVIGTVNPVAVGASGIGSTQQQVEVGATPGPVSVADLIANPQNYYVNIHTPADPAGVVRGQLAAANMTVLMGLLNGANEGSSTATSAAAGVGTIVALRATDASSNNTSGYVIFNVNYTGFPATDSVVGMHIHTGAAGVNGAVVISSGLTSTAVGADGTGTLHEEVALVPSDGGYTQEMAALSGLFSSPAAYYINVHTTSAPGGLVRSQTRTPDSAMFLVTMTPQTEGGSGGVAGASGLAPMSFYALRNADGSVAAGTVVFDVNYSGLGANASIVGLHVHQGAAGVSGPVVIPTNIPTPIASATGQGNVYQIVTVSDTAGIAALNSLVQDPSGFYVNLHTTTAPGGAIRGQVAAAVTAAPMTNPVVSAADFHNETAAPGEIVSVFGTNLALNTTGLTGFLGLATLPVSLDGVSVTIGGVAAPIYYVSPGQLNLQVPFGLTPGAQPVVVSAPNGKSATMNLTITAAAPSIFVADFNSGIGAVLENSTFALIDSANPAHAGDVILIYSTGLGQTTPASVTGSLTAPYGGFNNAAATTVSIGGQTVTPIYSFATPGSAGLYQTAVAIPASVSGTVPLTISVGGVVSNSVSLPVM